MKAYSTAAAWRQALEARLATQARDTGMDLARLRRRLVFIRLLTRLEQARPGQWVLKGGMALEVRLGARARSTRDLDLALRPWLADPEAIREDLITVLSEDHDEDRFQFRVSAPETLEVGDAGAKGLRFSLEAHLAGRLFERVRVDVVPRSLELLPTERLLLPDLLHFAGVLPIEVEVVDRRQHFAEKIHALTRTYGDRPNTRVKDLPDLLLLIHDGLRPNPTLRAAVEKLFAARGSHAIPLQLAQPPAAWDVDYARLSEELDLPETTIEQAMATLRQFWATLLGC